MAIGGAAGGESDEPLSEINVTPLVDVMLVLLVIFIVAAPLMAQALRVDLPKAEAPSQSEPEVIALVLRKEGEVEIDRQPVPTDALVAALRRAAQDKPQAVLQFGGDAEVNYQRVAEVLSAARQAGISKIAFATQAP